MIDCGSQCFLCDVPIRFDTYRGCTHNCKYCFVYRKYDINNIKVISSNIELKNFISGKRNQKVNWCDWDIPLHWGECLTLFNLVRKNTGYLLNA